MINSSVNLANSLVIPKEGSFKPNGNFFSVEISCDDLNAASGAFTLEGSLSNTSFGTVYDGTTEIVEALTSGVTCFRTFYVDPDSYYRITFQEGLTGTVSYYIAE